MAKRRLTDRTIKSLKPASAGGRYDIMDDLVTGFGVRVTDKGQKTFVLVARYPDPQRTRSGEKINPTRGRLGKYGTLTLEEARAKARDWIGDIQRGIDPRREEERQRSEQITRQANSFAAVAEDFIRLALPKQRKGEAVARELRKEFVELYGARPIDAITARDIVSVLDAAVERGAPYQAHNLLGHVRRLFNWAIARGVYGIERSPCDRMKPADVIGKKALRSRVLTDAEIGALWSASEALRYPFGPIFELLMVTGQRKSEVAEAQWSEFDLAERLWTIPPGRMKGDAAHVVPLTDEALAILARLPRFENGDYLFSTTFGEKPVNGFSKAKNRLDDAMLDRLRAAAEKRGEDPRKAKLEPFVIHDIRRTVRTRLSALPIPDLVRELVIAHARPGLHKVYDQYAYLDEKRQALDLWAGRLRDIIRPAPANVVSIETARA